LKNLFDENGGDPSLALRRCPEQSEGMTKSPEKRFLSAISRENFFVDIHIKNFLF